MGLEQWELYGYKIHLNNIYGLYIMLNLNYKPLCFIFEYILKHGLCSGKNNIVFFLCKEHNKFELLNLTNKDKLMIKSKC